MAFTASSGWGNLPNGNWSPVIYSKMAQKAFRKSSVVEDITNNTYMGEIANFGDSVRIIREPDITISNYVRGKTIAPQDLDDDDFTLVVDRGKSYAFAIEDIEAKMSHIDWMAMASDRAAYKMRDAYDEDNLGYLTGFTKDSGSWAAITSPTGTVADPSAGNDEYLAANQLYADDFTSGAGSTEAVVVGTDGTFDATPLEIFNRVNRLMDVVSVPKEGRWAVVDPVFIEKMMDENSKLVNEDYNKGSGEGLNNGKLTNNMIRGFRVYNSNNLPYLGTGAGTVATTSARSTTNLGFITFGHDSAVATASNFVKSETLRSQDTFADIVRGLQVYGRKILRPEALYRVAYNVNK